MVHLPGIFALIVGAAGWYYLFYSQAVQRLGEIENPAMNQQRSRLRRINGFAMLLLGALFYIGFNGVNDREEPGIFVLVWLAVSVLLILIVALAFIDVRLTARLKRK